MRVAPRYQRGFSLLAPCRRGLEFSSNRAGPFETALALGKFSTTRYARAGTMCPGFLKYFCRLLVCGSDEVGELEAMIAVADQEEIGLAMMAMARRWNELAKPDKALPNKIAV